MAEDPQSEEVISERIVATGGWARLSGTNLEKVEKVALKQINIAESKTNQEVEISDITYVESDSYIEFKIPSETVSIVWYLLMWKAIDTVLIQWMLLPGR